MTIDNTDENEAVLYSDYRQTVLRAGVYLVLIEVVIGLFLHVTVEPTLRMLATSGMIFLPVLYLIFVSSSAKDVIHRAYAYATARAPARRVKTVDLYISSPMAAYAPDERAFAETRSLVKLAFDTASSSRLQVESPALAITSISAGFDPADVALRRNAFSISISRALLLIYPSRLHSSVLVEAGLALADCEKVFVLVRDPHDLPYLLRTEIDPERARGDGLPSVIIHKYKTEADVIDFMRDKVIPALKRDRVDSD